MDREISTQQKTIGLMLTREILYNHNFKFSLESKAKWTEFGIEI